MFDQFITLLKALNEFGVRYKLVGGVALNLHGIIRATEDIDLFIDPAPANIVKLKKALASVWDDPEIEQIGVEDFAGSYPTIRYGPPEGELVIDLLSRLGDTFAFDDIESEVVELDGVRVRVATPAALFAMKRDTIRPVDQADAAALKDRFDLDEN